MGSRSKTTPLGLAKFKRLGKRQQAQWRRFGYHPTHTQFVWNGFAELNKTLTHEQRKAQGRKSRETQHRLYGLGKSRQAKAHHKQLGIIGERTAPGDWLARQVKRR